MADTSWMIYGANGYTGTLAAREAGEVSPGAWTPARAFGTHYIDGFPGVTPGEILDGRAG